MTIEHPAYDQLPALRQLWKDTFADTDAFLDGFFAVGFHPNRCLCATDGKSLLGAVYWFDCTCCEEPLAYIYALAVERTYHGRGIGSSLMEAVHTLLSERGYRGILLVPQEEGLIRMYERMGYRLRTGLREFTCCVGANAVNVNRIDTQTFARLRRAYLPEAGVVQEGENLAFLQTQAVFYAGEDFLLTARQENGRLIGLELLGNTDAAPGILRALSCHRGAFRVIGKERNFAMYRPLCDTHSCAPSYFAFAFD